MSWRSSADDFCYIFAVVVRGDRVRKDVDECALCSAVEAGVNYKILVSRIGGKGEGRYLR